MKIRHCKFGKDGYDGLTWMCTLGAWPQEARSAEPDMMADVMNKCKLIYHAPWGNNQDNYLHILDIEVYFIIICIHANFKFRNKQTFSVLSSVQTVQL